MIACQIMTSDIPGKASKILNVIFVAMVVIFARVWYLAIVQHDEHVIKAHRPQRHLTLEKVERGLICDRFGIVLAENEPQYNVGVCYAEIRAIPRITWDRSQKNSPKKLYARRDYIQQLSTLLSQELDVPADTIEDLIHGKAALFPHTPFIIKQGVSETTYYHLKMLEKDWRGIYTELGSRRHYPFGKTGCDVIGYLGAISGGQYRDIAHEIQLLENYLQEREAGGLALLPQGFQNPLEVRERLKQLKEKSYTIHDLVGKSGVEASCEEALKGYVGKRFEEVDTQGTPLSQLPGGQAPIGGQRVNLALSIELQAFAEELLTRNEPLRHASSGLQEPWIKGGAIVALDPKTADILALASYPRFDPNDFIPGVNLEEKHTKLAAVRRWLENESYIAAIWDGRLPLAREKFDPSTRSYYDETLELSWDLFLSGILSKNSPLFEAVEKLHSLPAAYSFQKQLDLWLKASGQKKMHVLLDTLYDTTPHIPSRQGSSMEDKQRALAHLVTSGLSLDALDLLFAQLPHNDDKLLLVDLCHLALPIEHFSDELIEAMRRETLSGYRELTQSYATFYHELESQLRTWFHEKPFKKWRDEHFGSFLKKMRKEEKEKGLYAKPYTDYLELLEKEHFHHFWKENEHPMAEAFFFQEGLKDEIFQSELAAYWEACNTDPRFTSLRTTLRRLPGHLRQPLLKTFRRFDQLTSPLYGMYRTMRHEKGVQLEKHLAAALYPLAGFGSGGSHAFRQATPLGSVFKVVVGYQALLEKYLQLPAEEKGQINPLTLLDDQQGIYQHPNKQILGYMNDGSPIYRFHRGGKLPRSRPHIGRIDLEGALEQSSNLYFSLLASEYIGNPKNLITICRLFGFGERSGIDLPGEYRGSLPDDLCHNKTGLYAFAIGQHSLVVTPLQTALMLAAISHHGEIVKPKIIHSMIGQEPNYGYGDPFQETNPTFAKALHAIGLAFPLFLDSTESKAPLQTWVNTRDVVRTLPMPDEIVKILTQGMHRVVSGAKGTARPSIIRLLHQDSTMRNHFYQIQADLIGKTGTAEILFKHGIDASAQAKIQNHIWFGGICFEEGSHLSEPELVVVVYLRLSEAGGKEAAPLATEIMTRWREIKRRHAL